MNGSAAAFLIAIVQWLSMSASGAAIPDSAAENQGESLAMRGALYYDRGHYWIEIAFRNAAGRDTLPAGLIPARFAIRAWGSDEESFRPSRIETFDAPAERPFLILTSARIEGGRCYRVTFSPPTGSVLAADSICDPFYSGSGGAWCRSKTFFHRYVAAAFARDGDAYRLNRLSYEYNFSGERTSTSLAVEPRVRLGAWVLDALFTEGLVIYCFDGVGRKAAGRRSIAAGVTGATWARDLKCSLSARYRLDRSAFDIGSIVSGIYSQQLAVEGRVRLDNCFDGVNRPCVIVFKGMEVAFGYAWHWTNGESAWLVPRLQRMTPVMKLRATGTVFYGFQLSYSLESYWASFTEDAFTEFHSLRLRLLLRDVLPGASGKPWHPDIEAAWDAGRRFPLFGHEEKLSIGFTFELYPW